MLLLLRFLLPLLLLPLLPRPTSLPLLLPRPTSLPGSFHLRSDPASSGHPSPPVLPSGAVLLRTAPVEEKARSFH